MVEDRGALELHPECPQCGSRRNWQDGWVHFSDSRPSVQRFLCRQCGLRFESATDRENGLKNGFPVFRNIVESLNVRFNNESHSKCAGKSPKNLLGAMALNPTESMQERAAGTLSLDEATIKGKVLDHLRWLCQEGYTDSTVLGRSQILRYMEKNVNLADPDAVREFIATKSRKPGRRANLIYAYALFAKWAGLPFTLPRINIPATLPFVPSEREIDDLIAGCTRYIGTFMQLCKESGARAGEIGSLRWVDIDFESATLRVAAEKGSNPRMCKLSNKAIQMLNQLPRKHPTVFIGQYKNIVNLRSTYCKQRKRLAAKMGNPRLLQIHFHTLRHWKGTMEYHKTKDILHVMQVLGHKRIQNTLRYIHLVNFEDDAYICKVGKTQEELSTLIEAGFEYVCECEGMQYFRKLK